MTLIVQDDDGLVAGANSYVDAAYIKAYWLDRGDDLSATYTDAQIEAALVQSTTFLDSRFRYVGERRNKDQTTEWPRRDAEDRDGYYIEGVPVAIKRASSELAQRALATTLLPDPVRDDSGRVVEMKSEKVGPLTETTKYAAGGAYVPPEYPLVCSILGAAGLIITGIEARRA